MDATLDTPFHDALVERLERLIAAAGESTTALAVSMGRSHTWLLRKLVKMEPYTSRGSTRVTDSPLFSTDVDLILAHLGAPVEAILDPKWIDSDAAAEWLTARCKKNDPA